MAQLEEGFKRIPGFEDYYAINEEWKIASYMKFGWRYRWWYLCDKPVSFVRWQVWSWHKAKNAITVQLHKDWYKRNLSIRPIVKKLFWVICVDYPRKWRRKEYQNK